MLMRQPQSRGPSHPAATHIGTILQPCPRPPKAAAEKIRSSKSSPSSAAAESTTEDAQCRGWRDKHLKPTAALPAGNALPHRHSKILNVRWLAAPQGPRQ